MASFVDSLVADVRKVQGEGEFQELVARLNQCEEQLSKVEVSVLDTMIECLDVSTHSLGVMAALVAKVGRSKEQADWKLLIQQMKEFSNKFDVLQINENPLVFCNLYHQFTERLCEQRRISMQGIPIVRIALEKFRKSSGHLTALHSDLIQLCLLAKNVKPALPFLAQEFSALQDENEQLDAKYVLLYYYYGGMVFTCLHDYLQALLFFTVCVTTPTMVISAVMVAAYKKFILVSLLKFGKEISLPRYSLHIVERVLKPLCGAYIQLSKAFCSGKAGSVQAVVDKFQDTYSRDGNTGLIRRLVARVSKHNVQTLTHTFMTVGLADVSTRLQFSGAKEAEKYIRDMIEDDEVHASLDQAEGMVSFVENPEHYDSLPMVNHMETQLQQCVALQMKLATLDKQLALDPRYMHKQMATGMDDDPMFHDEAL